MKSPPGYIIYEGPSRFDLNVAIVAIMTMFSKNDKTDNIVQTWILRQDMNPLEALQKNMDDAICSSCIHRIQRTCYVNVGRAPQAVYKSWLAGKYPPAPANLKPLLAHRALRIGSYGDPAAIPTLVWNALTVASNGHTGYTHFWRENPELAAYCMASVDTPQERAHAKILGFRTFRTKHEWQPRLPGEAHCPAAEEMGKKLKCLSCKACDGNARSLSGDVTLNLHGKRGHLLRAE